MLTVLNVAYPLASVGPDAVGGAEQVLSAIDHALINQGHTSLVIAPDGSQVRGELIPIPAFSGANNAETARFAHHHCRIAIREILSRRNIDLVHLHGVDFPAYLPPPGVAVLATLHLPVSWYPPEIFGFRRPRSFLHCVSRSQHRDCPRCEYLLPPIRNGVEIPQLEQPKRLGYALAIGRICPEKGFHLALEAASRAGVRMVLAGKVFPYESHQKYFREEILPRLGRDHSFVGPIGRAAKTTLYAGARCLVVPSTVAETSSLVALEALACGTPVVAFRAGALPEIVVDGQTGFLVDTVDQMAEAILRAHEIDPQQCSASVRERFSVEQMTAGYLETYRSCCGLAARTG